MNDDFPRAFSPADLMGIIINPNNSIGIKEFAKECIVIDKWLISIGVSISETSIYKNI